MCLDLFDRSRGHPEIAQREGLSTAKGMLNFSGSCAIGGKAGSHFEKYIGSLTTSRPGKGKRLLLVRGGNPPPPRPPNREHHVPRRKATPKILLQARSTPWLLLFISSHTPG
jgi:hypothetical protein